MHGLLVQAWLEALARRLVAAMAQHIARNVAAVDVHAGAQQRQEQAPHAAAQIQRGLAELGDLALEKRRFRGVGVELGAPLCHQTIEPGNGLIGHRYVLICFPTVWSRRSQVTGTYNHSPR